MDVRFSLLALLLLASTSGVAQETPSVIGKWTGNYTSGSNTTISVVLDIKNIDGEKLEGMGSLYSTARVPQCSGNYPIEGTLKGTELKVRSTDKGGPGGDCRFNLTGTVEGNKLLAKRGTTEFVMRK
jgi:hypothetical protein